ncbi:hypothetical protein [Sphingorhabdus sp.]|uniref:hypothetical protein n=1 Tax=Sphingorhabdus sp. TaxID=1902408 RepID=UPI003CC6026E
MLAKHRVIGANTNKQNKRNLLACDTLFIARDVAPNLTLHQAEMPNISAKPAFIAIPTLITCSPS